MVNLVLKQHYKSKVLEAEGSGTSDAKGGLQTAILRLARIDGAHRRNAMIRASRSDSLHAGDRFDEATLAAAAPDTTARTSLTSATEMVNLDAGFATPWGRKNLALSVNGSFSRNHRNVAAPELGQTNPNINLGTSASLNGLSRNRFWMLNLSLNAAHNNSTLHGGTDPVTPSTSTRSDTLLANAAASSSGPLFRLLAHTATYDTNLAYQRSSFHQSAGLDIPGSSNSQQSLNTSGGLSLPLHASGKSHSLLGQLSLGGHINAQRTTASAWVTGYDSNASWTPINGLQFDAMRSVIGLPGGTASALSVQTNVLVFDPQTHQDVRVTQLISSNPDLRSSSITSTDLRATIMHRAGPTQISLGVSYDTTSTSHPSWTPTLSDIAERAFPNHFLRDAGGQLVQVETPPVNALRQSESQIGFNLHLSGGHRMPRNAAAAPPPTVPPRFSPITWNLMMSTNWKMRSTLQLTAAGPVYDLNNASIGTGGGGSRRTTNIMAGMMKGPSGAHVLVNWNGSARLLGQGGADGIYRQPLKVNMSLFTILHKGKAPQSGVQMTLAVDNLLDRRPIVRFPDRATPFSQLAANLDPLGRVIKLSLRATMP